MDKKTRTYLIYGAGAIAAYLLYRWWQGNQTASSGAGTNPTDQAAGDYAALAGQEQADVGALQSSNAQFQSQVQRWEFAMAKAFQRDQQRLVKEMQGLERATLKEGGTVKRLQQRLQRLRQEEMNRRPPKQNPAGKHGQNQGPVGHSPHTPQHQAGQRGHHAGHAGNSVAARSNGIKAGIRNPNSKQRTITVTHPHHQPAGRGKH